MKPTPANGKGLANVDEIGKRFVAQFAVSSRGEAAAFPVAMVRPELNGVCMARERLNTSKLPDDAGEAPTSGEQLELVAKSPAEKELESRAKTWLSIKEKRGEYLKDAKKKEDEAHEKMVESAIALKLNHFVVSNRVIDINNKLKAVSKNASIKKKKKKKAAAAA